MLEPDIATPYWVDVICAFLALLMALFAGAWLERNKERIAEKLENWADRMRERAGRG